MKTKSNILVVDDDLDGLMGIVSVLMSSEKEYNVLQASSAADAYKVASERLPDLIISDWNMPDKSGIDLIFELKANTQTKNIPVIITTGYMLSPLDLKTALEAGAMDYITKPIKQIELEARVNSALMLAKSHKEILKLKNDELINNALSLVKVNEFVKALPNKLTPLKDLCVETQETVKSVEKDIEDFLKSNIWELFDASFDNQHSEFYKRLLEQFPKLTPKEIKMSALLLLGMNTKDIASLLYQEVDSIKVARYRLRKKFGLSEKENLKMFLLSI